MTYGRPSLVTDLLQIPANHQQHQLENQATAVLAWLGDRSNAIGSALVDLFLGTPPPADALIAIRTQVSLPKPDGGALRPDLSLCVSDRRVQLLIEVKVDAAFATYSEYDGLDQPAVYRRLWHPGEPGDAKVRAVGTLTRQGSPRQPDPDSLIARDVSWRELRNTLHQLHANGLLSADVELVTSAFIDAIDERIAPPEWTDEQLAAFFAEHRGVLDHVKGQIASRWGSEVAAKAVRGRAYHGWRIPLADIGGGTMFLRLYLAPAGTRLNLPGAPAALIAAPERDANGNLEDFEAIAINDAGFVRSRDHDGYWLHRRLWPLNAIDADRVTSELSDALTAADLVPRGSPPTVVPRGAFTLVVQASNIGEPVENVFGYAKPLPDDHLWDGWTAIAATRRGAQVTIDDVRGPAIPRAIAQKLVEAARVYWPPDLDY